MIGRFLKERAARAARKRHMAGYEYAAGALLSTNGLAETIRDLECSADGTFDRDAFDDGINEAIRDWEKARGRLVEIEALATVASVSRPSDAQSFKARVRELARGGF